MIEQQANKLILTFPTPEAAAAFAQFLQSLVTVTASPLPPPSQPLPPLAAAPSSPPSAQGQQATGDLPDSPSPPTPDSLAPDPSPLFHSRHTVLTPERQDQLFNQRQSGQTAHDRLLRAQTTLRDGVLPFSRPGPQAPPPTGQPSPRIKAAQEGGFADGSGEEPEAERRGERRGSRLRPVPPSPLSPPKSAS